MLLDLARQILRPGDLLSELAPQIRLRAVALADSHSMFLDLARQILRPGDLLIDLAPHFRVRTVALADGRSVHLDLLGERLQADRLLRNFSFEAGGCSLLLRQGGL